MKIKRILLVAVAATAMNSCSSSSYNVEGLVKDNTVKKVYLFKLKSSTVDTAYVEAGKFSFKGNLDGAELASIETSNGMGMPVILENGKVTVNFDEGKTEGGNLNAKLEELNERITEITKAVDEKFVQIKDDDDINVNEVMMKFIEDSIKPQAEATLIAAIKDNSNNALGAFAFLMSVNMGGQEKVAELSKMLDPKILEYKDIAKLINDIKAVGLTEVGKKFVDFEVEKGGVNGETVALSDYLGKGKYVLVDFFASWCGPCKAEVKYIKEAYKKYAGEKFDVLGIALWDKIEDTKKAVKEEEMTWPIIYNAQEKGTDLYGISGVPLLLLVDPQGVIVERGFRGAEMVEKIGEYLEKK